MKKLLGHIAFLARSWATYQRVRAELETYTDRELADMGIGRADITRIAIEAASLVKQEPKATAEGSTALLRQRYSASH
jgi:uncharacterized protein YjiS (DUF1127 family)